MNALDLKTTLSRPATITFTYPGSATCVIKSMLRIIYACDGTEINTGRMVYWALDGADRNMMFGTVDELLDAKIWSGNSINDILDDIEWRVEP